MVQHHHIYASRVRRSECSTYAKLIMIVAPPSRTLNINGHTLCLYKQFGREAFYLPERLAQGRFAGKLWWPEQVRKKYLYIKYLPVLKRAKRPRKTIPLHIQLVHECLLRQAREEFFNFTGNQC